MTMRMINPTKTATVFAPLLALLYAFPANAAAAGPTRSQVLTLWANVLFIIAATVVLITAMVIRNLDNGNRHVDPNPADRKIVRTCVTIMWSCVAVAWAAVVATGAHQPALIDVLLIQQPYWMTLVTFLLSIQFDVRRSGGTGQFLRQNTRLHNHPSFMIVAALVAAFGLAACLLTVSKAWIAAL